MSVLLSRTWSGALPAEQFHGTASCWLPPSCPDGPQAVMDARSILIDTHLPSAICLCQRRQAWTGRESWDGLFSWRGRGCFGLGGAHRAARVRRLERLEGLEDSLLQADRPRGKKDAFRAMVLQVVAGSTNQTRGEEISVKRTNCWRVGDGARCPSGMLVLILCRPWWNDKRKSGMFLPCLSQKLLCSSVPSRWALLFPALPSLPSKADCAFRAPVGVWRGRSRPDSI